MLSVPTCTHMQSVVVRTFLCKQTWDMGNLKLFKLWKVSGLILVFCFVWSFNRHSETQGYPIVASFFKTAFHLVMMYFHLNHFFYLQFYILISILLYQRATIKWCLQKQCIYTSCAVVPVDCKAKSMVCNWKAWWWLFVFTIKWGARLHKWFTVLFQQNIKQLVIFLSSFFYLLR